LRPRREHTRVKKKKVLSSIPGEGISCGSETKYDTRMVPRPNLFVSKRILRNEGYKTENCPDEDGFCSLKTKHDRRAVPWKNLFLVSVRKLQEQSL
jgi:hypothetical protein